MAVQLGRLPFIELFNFQFGQLVLEFKNSITSIISFIHSFSFIIFSSPCSLILKILGSSTRPFPSISSTYLHVLRLLVLHHPDVVILNAEDGDSTLKESPSHVVDAKRWSWVQGLWLPPYSGMWSGSSTRPMSDIVGVQVSGRRPLRAIGFEAAAFFLASYAAMSREPHFSMSRQKSKANSSVLSLHRDGSPPLSDRWSCTVSAKASQCSLCTNRRAVNLGHQEQPDVH